MRRNNKKHGCSTFLLAFVWLFFVIYIGSDSSVDTETTPANMATTATIAPTNTPEPDLKAMTAQEAAETATAFANSSTCTTRAVSAESDVCMIEIDMDHLFSDNSAMINSIQYCCDLAPMIFKNDDIPMIYLQFFEKGRDKYGNEIDMMTITMRLTRDTAEKMNFEYFDTWAYTRQLAFFSVLDGYSLYGEYKKIAQ